MAKWLIVWIVRLIILENRKWLIVRIVRIIILENRKWLIVWIVTLIILENRKWFLISYLNSNTFHVESSIRFKSMQSIFVNAFLIENN